MWNFYSIMEFPHSYSTSAAEGRVGRGEGGMVIHSGLKAGVSHKIAYFPAQKGLLMLLAPLP
jgi:hypothetical protein